ncbi:MAG TPA: DUF222 domain-containing protein, partial [Micromonosporaceae bacterium]
MDGDLATAAASVAAFAARPAYALSSDDIRSSLGRLHRIATVVAATMAVMAQEAAGRDLPRGDGAASAVAWLRDLLRITAADASRLVALGQVMDRRPVLSDAVAAGAVNPSQALAIGRVLADVPADVAADVPADVAADVPDTEPGLVDKVEAVLIDHAHQFEPAILRRLGERALAHLNPDLADQRLRHRLDREERHARQRRGFTLAPDGLGGVRLRGVLDVEGAAIVAAAIAPLATPVTGDNGPDPRTAPMRRADALVDVCRLALRTGDLPADGGQPAQVTVTIDWQALSRDVAVGQLDTGTLLSPSATRRLACDAGILPAVLNGASIPIDLGRARRPYTGATRTAVLLRDRGCAFPGCDRP